ncbi:aspartate racemase/maleate isomerase family protein [Amorphus sp. MBR-141]
MLSRGVAPRVLSSDSLALVPSTSVTRLGLLLLATDLRSEIDAARLLPAGEVAVHAARVAFDNPTTPENLRDMEPRLATAAALLTPGTPLSAIYYACTSASAVIGDEAIDRTIGASQPGIPIVTPTRAARIAFDAMSVRRVALVTPYIEATALPMIAYFGSHGIEITSALCFGFEDDRTMARISPESLVDATLRADVSAADAVFVSCTALPALDVVAELEARLGKPVVTANQAALWMMRHFAGLTADPGGAGRLFALSPS